MMSSLVLGLFAISSKWALFHSLQLLNKLRTWHLVFADWLLLAQPGWNALRFAIVIVIDIVVVHKLSL